jgi:hypothetical protein
VLGAIAARASDTPDAGRRMDNGTAGRGFSEYSINVSAWVQATSLIACWILIRFACLFCMSVTSPFDLDQHSTGFSRKMVEEREQRGNFGTEPNTEPIIPKPKSSVSPFPLHRSVCSSSNTKLSLHRRNRTKHVG